MTFLSRHFHIRCWRYAIL